MSGGEASGPLEVVILGGGTAGWMCAAGLVRHLDPRDYRITLVESDEIGTVGVGEATLPHIKRFNDGLGIDEAEFMAETRATFKLGIEFRDWGRLGDSYIHPFGAFGEPWGGVAFQHHWLRLKAVGVLVRPLEAYSFAIAAARRRAFDFPDPDPASIRSTFSYAYHFDAGRYAAFLRRWAIDRGVTRIEGRVAEVERAPQSGDVAALALADGSRVEGDFFIDCSGFRALLIGETLGAPWEDWREWLPCDRAWAVPSETAADCTPFTRATAREAGWTWRIPLQHRTGNGYVFSTRFTDEARARELLLSVLGEPALGEPRLLRFEAGRRSECWRGNCVAIGLASGFLEPLESTSIYLIQAAVQDLIALMPGRGGSDPRLIAEFNRLTALQYDRIRDFLVLHYAANRRTGQPLWDHVRTMKLPDSLAEKIALFEARGAVPDYRLGLFSPDSWLAVLAGQGLVPRAYDPLADTLPLDTVADRMADFAGRIDAAVATMPDHAAFLRGYCPAEVAA